MPQLSAFLSDHSLLTIGGVLYFACEVVSRDGLTTGRRRLNNRLANHRDIEVQPDTLWHRLQPTMWHVSLITMCSANIHNMYFQQVPSICHM